MFCDYQNGKGAEDMKRVIKKFIHQLQLAAYRGFSWVDHLRQGSTDIFILENKYHTNKETAKCLP